MISYLLPIALHVLLAGLHALPTHGIVVDGLRICEQPVVIRSSVRKTSAVLTLARVQCMAATITSRTFTCLHCCFGVLQSQCSSPGGPATVTGLLGQPAAPAVGA
jgi:hypothetical protein